MYEAYGQDNLDLGYHYKLASVEAGETIDKSIQRLADEYDCDFEE